MTNSILSKFSFLPLIIGMTLLLSKEPCQALTGYPGFNLGAGYGFGSGSDQGDNYDPARMASLQFFAIGTTHTKGMYLGFRYEQQNLKYASMDGKQTSIGGTIGIGQRGCYVLAHSFWKISRDTESGQVQGTGTGYDFGYQFPFFYKNFLTTGVQYSLRYTKYENQATTNQHMPMLVLGGNF